jgi:hypothetical protein
MSQRSANYAIKGYLYQFYKTIEQILSSSENTEVTVEGIEDIDLNEPNAQNLIQCKYHDATRFAPSVVYKPIGLMLKHSIESAPVVSSYTLYAYFRENSPADESWITDEFLRKALNNRDEKATASDEQLTSFRTKFRFVAGASFDELSDQIHNALQTALNCRADEVELYYHNNAVALITEIAARTDLKQRQTTKAAFLSHINGKNFLFDLWQHELKGKQAYIKTIKERLKRNNALADIKRRFLFISRELANAPTAEVSLNTLLHNLVTQYGIVDRLYNSELWTVIIDAEPSDLQAVKTYLVKRGIYFNDGYEAVSFCGRYFNDMPIINTKRPNHDKVKKTSHALRLISAATFKEKLDNVVDTNKHPHVFINTSRSLHDNQFFSDKKDISIYRLAALDTLAELNEILKRER